VASTAWDGDSTHAIIHARLKPAVVGRTLLYRLVFGGMVEAFLHPLCIMVVNCGACIPPVAKHRKHGLLYSPSMTDTLGTFVGSSMLRLVLCCLRS